MATEIDLVVEQLKELNTNMKSLQTEFSEFKTEVRTGLTETNGKLKGNFELMDKSIKHLEKQNDTQHDAIGNKVQSVTDTLAGHKTQIDRLYDLDRDRTKREDEIKSAVIEKCDANITATAVRLSKETADVEARLNVEIGEIRADLHNINDTLKAVGENAAATRMLRNIIYVIIGLFGPSLVGGGVALIKMWAIVSGGM